MTETITTFVTFSMQSNAVDTFKTAWLIDAAFIARQPGLKGGNLYKRVDNDGRVEFVNVAHWESASAMNAAREAALVEQEREGRDQASSFEVAGINVSAQNYVVDVAY